MTQDANVSSFVARVGADMKALKAETVAGSGITDVVALTQAAYDALTPDATTLYFITG